MRRIIDCHIHLIDDSQVEWAREIGYDKVCLMDPRPEVLERALKKHPDFIVGLGWLPLDREVATALKAVDTFRDLGCRGYKICFSDAPYDDPKYYPIYEKIQSYNMPIFFHTGWLDQRLACHAYPAICKPRAQYFHPMTLDRLTLDFPQLKLVAFHLGGTHLSDCALLMRNHPNIYADTCARFEPLDHFYNQVGGQPGLQAVLGKLVVGTDGMAARPAMEEWISMIQRVMDHFKLSEGLRERIWYKTALRVLNMDDELRRVAKTRKIESATLDQALAGRLNWPCIEGFLDLLGTPATSQTRCYVGYSEQALQIVAVCRDENPAGMRLAPNALLRELWQEESVEFFVSPQRNSDYFHIVASASGRAFIHKGRHTLTVDELPATAKIGKDAWAVKVEIPFATLTARPRSGTRWGLNLCRNKIGQPQESSSWNEVASTYHDPSSFGYLEFE